MDRRLTVFAAMTAVVATAHPGPALTIERTKVGTLFCDISAGIGLIVTSKKNLTCMFMPSQHGPREVYSGTISKYGLDLGVTAGGEMIWAVYVSSKKRFGALAGQYSGVGAGLGANLLVGGSDRTVTLQPVSVQSQDGLNLAVGVAGIDLRPAR
jgi:Protein of unknown function (DUF992)